MIPSERSPQWLTVREFALILDCTERNVLYRIEDLTLADFGLAVYSIRHGRRVRRYIHTPPSMFQL